MGKPTGFIEYTRQLPADRSPLERIKDWDEFHLHMPEADLRTQGARCMDCGVPFCHSGVLISGMASGCPINNLIPEWNDLVYRNLWRQALDRLHKTNNFPEFTGMLCPAPCEGSCVLGINKDPVTIKSIELAIIDRAFDEGWMVPRPPANRTWKKVAVIGSGPAGLAAADQLNRAGHSVTVFEKSDRIGGLLRYGIPEFKLEKRVLNRRLDLLSAEGVVFRTRVNVGEDFAAADLRREFDAVLLAGGAGQPRDLNVPGRELKGVHFAVDYLTQQNRHCEGDEMPWINATGKHVIIIGGGDTGADCLGTVHRQGAASVAQLELMPTPPKERAENNPWPLWPHVFRTSSAHEEGGDRVYAVATTELAGVDGRVRALRGQKVADGTPFEMKADLVLLAMGFVGPEKSKLLADLDVKLTERGNVWRDDRWMTSVPGVFAAGDMQRGQSLIVWAIDDGRRAAAAIDAHLSAN